MVNTNNRFKCTKCKKVFSRKFNLNRHMQSTNCVKSKTKSKKKNIKKSDIDKNNVDIVIDLVTDPVAEFKNDSRCDINLVHDPLDELKDELELVSESPDEQLEEPIDESKNENTTDKKQQLKDLNDELSLNNERLRIINESMKRCEDDIKDVICDNNIISKIRDVVLADILNNIKNTKTYSDNKEIADELFKIFEPFNNVSYNIESILTTLVGNRIDVIKYRADRLSELKKDKLKLLNETSNLTKKIIELLN